MALGGLTWLTPHPYRDPPLCPLGRQTLGLRQVSSWLKVTELVPACNAASQQNRMLGCRVPASTYPTPPTWCPSEPSHIGSLDSFQTRLSDQLLQETDGDTEVQRRKGTGRGSSFLEVKMIGLSLCSRDRCVPPYLSPQLH